MSLEHYIEVDVSGFFLLVLEIIISLCINKKCCSLHPKLINYYQQVRRQLENEWSDLLVDASYLYN